MPPRPVRAANILLLLLFPASWVAPLARAGFLPWFSGEEVSILGGVAELWEVDAALAVLVATFAVAIPYAKTCVLAAAHLGLIGARALPLVEAIGKLSMADVFLVALYIVVVKGVGFGHVSTAWGLWLFTGCVLASIWVGWATRRAMAPGIMS
jgi:paraquat-inducible protein A